LKKDSSPFPDCTLAVNAAANVTRLMSARRIDILLERRAFTEVAGVPS
jgi:hypothetical protein